MADNVIDFLSYKKKAASAGPMSSHLKSDKLLSLEVEQAEQLKRAANRNEANRDRLKRERERANSHVMKSYRLK